MMGLTRDRKDKNASYAMAMRDLQHKYTQL